MDYGVFDPIEVTTQFLHNNYLNSDNNPLLNVDKNITKNILEKAYIYDNLDDLEEDILKIPKNVFNIHGLYIDEDNEVYNFHILLTNFIYFYDYPKYTTKSEKHKTFTLFSECAVVKMKDYTSVTPLVISKYHCKFMAPPLSSNWKSRKEYEELMYPVRRMKRFYLLNTDGFNNAVKPAHKASGNHHSTFEDRYNTTINKIVTTKHGILDSFIHDMFPASCKPGTLSYCFKDYKSFG